MIKRKQTQMKMYRLLGAKPRTGLSGKTNGCECVEVVVSWHQGFKVIKILLLFSLDHRFKKK